MSAILRFVPSAFSRVCDTLLYSGFFACAPAPNCPAEVSIPIPALSSKTFPSADTEKYSPPFSAETVAEILPSGDFTE